MTLLSCREKIESQIQRRRIITIILYSYSPFTHSLLPGRPDNSDVRMLMAVQVDGTLHPHILVPCFMLHHLTILIISQNFIQYLKWIHEIFFFKSGIRKKVHINNFSDLRMESRVSYLCSLLPMSHTSTRTARQPVNSTKLSV